MKMNVVNSNETHKIIVPLLTDNNNNKAFYPEYLGKAI